MGLPDKPVGQSFLLCLSGSCCLFEKKTILLCRLYIFTMRDILIYTLLGLLLCGCRYDDSDLVHRIENLESRVATIDGQIGAINITIDELDAFASELELLIKEVESTADANAEDIAQLESAKESIESRIAELRDYVDRGIAENRSWVAATYATLSQYKSLAEDVAYIKATLSNFDSKIDGRISTLEGVMKYWVNSQLTGYYTIAEVEALLESMLQTIDDEHTAIRDELKSLSSAMNSMKASIVVAYTKAIEEAITQNSGVIDAKIAAEIEAVNSRIDSEVANINERIDAIEARVEELEDALDRIQALDVEFDIEELVYIPGVAFEFGYSVIGGDDETTVESFGDGGWSTRVTMVDASTGRIGVTPTDRGGEGKIVVIATSGVGGVCMKSLYFDEGVVKSVMDSYVVEWEAGTIDVTLTTNMTYDVRVAEDAAEWLSVVDTRAAFRDDVLTFAVTENGEESKRSGVVELLYGEGEVVYSFEIIQKVQPLSEPIIFADSAVKGACVERYDLNGDGELSYKEAAKVESLDASLLRNITESVTSFNELQYFVNLTSIPSSMFKGCANMQSITLPETITSIGEYAFYGCKSLERMDIPACVTNIGKYAFYSCVAISDIEIPDGIKTIGDSTFYGCESIDFITIPSSVTSIGNSAFMGCKNLQNITLPNSVTTIGGSAFRECSSMRNIYMSDSVLSMGEGAFKRCSSLTEISIPDFVTQISDEMFSGCASLKNITLPQGVTYVGANAFQGCSGLQRLVIPEGVTQLSDYILSDCTNLSTISIPSGILEIGKFAFSGCSSLQSLSIPEGVTMIGEYAFKNCSSISTIRLPEGIDMIKEYTFYGCSNLQSVNIPDGVTSFGNYAFYSCTNLTQIDMPYGVISIGNSAFYGCAMVSSVDIPDSVTSIGEKAFYMCSSMQRATIGSGVTSIGGSAFSVCSMLSEVYCTPVTPPSGATYMFDRNASDRKIYVPAESKERYVTTRYWSNYAQYLVGYTY